MIPRNRHQSRLELLQFGQTIISISWVFKYCEILHYQSDSLHTFMHIKYRPFVPCKLKCGRVNIFDDEHTPKKSWILHLCHSLITIKLGHSRNKLPYLIYLTFVKSEIIQCTPYGWTKDCIKIIPYVLFFSIYIYFYLTIRYRVKINIFVSSFPCSQPSSASIALSFDYSFC